MIGRLLGNRYEVLEKVGGGGMSLVYRAKDVYLNRIVAIKVLREQLTSDEEFVARFRREAQAVASLSHGNIVSIYDVGQDNGVYYLVMEMVEGRNLKEAIRERGRLPLKEAVEIARQICDALEHAHSSRIIHRDIKPHNIILMENGRAKVTDFGIARAVSTATVTHTGSIMGSVHYFSPEQARGEIADEKSDIYSLGVVLYEMMTGRLPFEGDSPISIALKKIHGEPEPPRKLNPEIGEAMERVILRAMASEPFQRYRSVNELRQDLVSALLYNKTRDGTKEEEMPEDTVTIPKLVRKKQRRDDLAVPFKIWTWVMISLMVIGFILGMYLSAAVMARGEVGVPDVVEMNITEAGQVLSKANLNLVLVRRENHPRIPKDLIISQVPKAEQVVKRNSKVEVVVSDGPTMVKVPNVLTSSLLTAEVTLNNEGLEVGEITRVYHEQIPSSQVVNQEPAAGKEVVQGTAVNLIVSKGAEPIWVKMPALTGLTLSQAKSILQNYNLIIGVVQPETSYKYAKDVVIRQDPGVDSEILQGSVVNLVVSAGPGPAGGQYSVSVTLPQSGRVKIVVDDEKSRQVVYEKYHYSGETVKELVNYQGKCFIEVYVDNKLVERKEV
ncbi:MAG: Stk1 family PASTA domain-containing Ser/Thr kinase [Peptococcaceae bacterium]|nr:Stk1 family PASTA domain-containing Ser/Thr kinase [Peptococcaceae bacterium]MDH7524286.1 Stk1 family PASTA domain-containing Ser/Thr kinase [Peptococcaceae bacterium]